MIKSENEINDIILNIYPHSTGIQKMDGGIDCENIEIRYDIEWLKQRIENILFKKE